MARAAFFTPHTFVFAAGIFLVGVVASLLRPETPTTQEADAIANMIMGLFAILFALFPAALFSLGCAWGGVPRLPKPGWALLAGIAVGAGLVAYEVLVMNKLPADVDLESHKLHGIYGMVRVAYVFLAPIIVGLLYAWAAKSKR